MEEFILDWDYSWMFKDGKMNKGLECVCRYEDWRYGWGDINYAVVKLTDCWPYWTSGEADPTIEQVNPWNYVEVDGDLDDVQVLLDNLFEIKRYDKAKSVLYDDHECECIGTAKDGEISVIKDGDKMIAIDSDDVELLHHISELTEDECLKLANEVCRGSCYGSDYRNSFGISTDEVYQYSEGYYCYLNDIEEEEDEEREDTCEEFADYMYSCACA